MPALRVIDHGHLHTTRNVQSGHRLYFLMLVNPTCFFFSAMQLIAQALVARGDLALNTQAEPKRALSVVRLILSPLRRISELSRKSEQKPAQGTRDPDIQQRRTGGHSKSCA